MKVLFIYNCTDRPLDFFVINDPRSDILAAMELVHGKLMNVDEFTEAEYAAYEILVPFIDGTAEELVPSAMTPGGWFKTNAQDIVDCKPDKIFAFTFVA